MFIALGLLLSMSFVAFVAGSIGPLVLGVILAVLWLTFTQFAGLPRTLVFVLMLVVIVPLFFALFGYNPILPFVLGVIIAGALLVFALVVGLCALLVFDPPSHNL